MARAQQAQGRRAGIAAFVGTLIEWYDFYIYGLAAALVFGPLFFPNLNPVLGTLASFATFGTAYIMRPVGAIVFGHFGDRIGRKQTLVVTLLIMGVATCAVGLLPTYASIGIAAPILLVICRLFQGFAAGGEWGGAVLIASEHAERKNFVSAGAWAQQGAPGGSLLASAVFVLVNLLPEQQFLSFGWRIPFLASAVLIVVGLVIRLKLEESPDFVQVTKENKTASVPLARVLKTAMPILILGAFSTAVATTSYPMLQVFGLNWMTGELGVARGLVLNGLLVMSAVQFIIQPFGALLALRFQPVNVIYCALAATVISVPAGWLLLATGSTAGIYVGLILTVLPVTIVYGLLGGFLAETYPAEIRQTGTGMSYQFGAMIFSSISPVLAAMFMDATGSIWSVIGLMLVYTTMAFFAFTALARRTGAGRRALEPEQPADPSAVASNGPALAPDPR
ncbi:MFS transporter [Rhodococcus koreensis]